jgi:hypothetical protein
MGRNFDGVVFDRDPLTRTVQIFHFDEQTEKITIEDRQEISNLLEHNKVMRQSGGQHDRKSGMRRAASIPLNLLAEINAMFQREGFDHEARQAWWKRWLNDPDNRVFRTDNTKV